MFGDYAPEVRITESVWLGQKKDAVGQANVCIKVISLPDSKERDTLPARRLLVSAAIQQAIAEHSVRWAPVLQLGSDGLDSFCVTQRYPRSLQTLIAEKIEINAEQLRMIMLEIVEGLVDLEHTYNLPHGNLKPSNVFFTSRFDIMEQSIRLSDPDGSADTPAELEQTSDAKSLGQILHSLVTFEDPTTAIVPLTDMNPWKRLGSSGRKWFELCNQLLDMPSRPGLSRLTELRAQITEIRIPRRNALMSVFF